MVLLAIVACARTSQPSPADTKVEENTPPPMKERTLSSPAQQHVSVLSDANLPEASRIAAVRSLAQSQEAAAVYPLCGTLETATDDLEAAITDALGALSAREVLLEDLKSGSDDMRARAAHLVALVPERDRAVPGLITALRDKTERVREESAATLGNIKHASAVKALASVLRVDVSARVRSAAAQALGMIGTNDARVALQEAAHVERDDMVLIFIERALKAG